MRTIKFRGKRVDNGEWMYGDLVRYVEPLLISDDIKEWVIIDEIAEEYTVDEETVGQFTGLHDKNGKDIYEDDIIKVRMYDFKYHKMKVQYQNGHFSVFDKNGLGCSTIYFDNDDCIVIGNIHDNKELLK